MGRGPFYRSLAPFRLWWTLPRPVDWAREFGRAAPLHLEIGCGNGDWLARRVDEAPGVNWVGLEPEWGRVMKVLRKLARRDARHVRVLAAGVAVALDRLFAPRALAAVTCLFPEPWPRARHVKHRLFSAAGLTRIASRLADGAALRVVTDDAGYADWIATETPACLALVRGVVGPAEGTWFERLWHGKGQPEFHELRLTKVAHPDVAVREDVPMRTHVCQDFAAERFAPADVRGRPDQGEVAVAWKDRLWDPAARCVMLRATVAEPALVQHLWIEIRAEADGWHVRPAQGCGFVPTAGVQRALDAARDAAAATS